MSVNADEKKGGNADRSQNQKAESHQSLQLQAYAGLLWPEALRISEVEPIEGGGRTEARLIIEISLRVTE